MTGATDPFSASIIPFEVPEQMRAFAEKGVSQARENYAKFKDVAESHNGTVEAVFTSASKGASEYTAKLVEFMKAHTRTQLETLQSQAKELVELTQRVAAETAEPIKASASKFYKPAA